MLLSCLLRYKQADRGISFSMCLLPAIKWRTIIARTATLVQMSWRQRHDDATWLDSRAVSQAPEVTRTPPTHDAAAAATAPASMCFGAAVPLDWCSWFSQRRNVNVCASRSLTTAAPVTSATEFLRSLPANIYSFTTGSTPDIEVQIVMCYSTTLSNWGNRPDRIKE